MELDFEMAQSWLEDLYESDDVLKIQIINHRCPGASDYRQIRTTYLERAEVTRAGRQQGRLMWLGEKNLQGWDVYCGVHPVRRLPDERGRPVYGAEARFVSRFAFLHADLDAGGPAALERLAEDVKADYLPAPTHLLRSSSTPPKYHLYWELDDQYWGAPDDAGAAGRVVAYNTALAERYGGDPGAVDVARILRVPGFVNRKPAYATAPPLVAATKVPQLYRLPVAKAVAPDQMQALMLLVRPEVAHRVFDRAELRSIAEDYESWRRVSVYAAERRRAASAGRNPEAVPVDELPPARHAALQHEAGRSRPESRSRPGGGVSGRGDHFSQSEADWRTVCRALESGAAADRLVRELAERRSPVMAAAAGIAPKHSPYYYACLTVTKAARKVGASPPTMTVEQARALDRGQRPARHGASPASSGPANAAAAGHSGGVPDRAAGTRGGAEAAAGRGPAIDRAGDSMSR